MGRTKAGIGDHSSSARKRLVAAVRAMTVGGDRCRFTGKRCIAVQAGGECVRDNVCVEG
jgi:hypothetical protein